ncbi:hypothetical protein T492DRAFT_905582 [Pavlovales sp. CCMP2436]|nr:hypothetical protein T492DRAFT_905582 [Pavlovales sp. CCMP2436]
MANGAHGAVERWLSAAAAAVPGARGAAATTAAAAAIAGGGVAANEQTCDKVREGNTRALLVIDQGQHPSVGVNYAAAFAEAGWEVVPSLGRRSLAVHAECLGRASAGEVSPYMPSASAGEGAEHAECLGRREMPCVPSGSAGKLSP